MEWIAFLIIGLFIVIIIMISYTHNPLRKQNNPKRREILRVEDIHGRVSFEGDPREKWYEHKGKLLTRKIASDLILELFDGQRGVPRRKINEKVGELHISRGGSLSRAPDVTIGTGLDRLRKDDKAYNQPTRFWHINSAGVDTDSREYKLYRDRLLQKRSK